MVVSDATIDSLLKAKEQYPPAERFRRHAIVHDEGILAAAAKETVGFREEASLSGSSRGTTSSTGTSPSRSTSPKWAGRNLTHTSRDRIAR